MMPIRNHRIAAGHIAVAIIGFCLLGYAAKADTLVATKPGLMCPSPDALARLTMPDGSSRTTRSDASAADIQLKASSGCIDIPVQAHVELLTARVKTSIVEFDTGDGHGQRLFIVPNTDFTGFSASAAPSPAAVATIPAASPSSSGAPTPAPPVALAIAPAASRPPSVAMPPAPPPKTAQAKPDPVAAVAYPPDGLRGDAIPPAPQEFLLRYFKALNPSIMDTGMLDTFSSEFMMADLADMGDNEIKRLLERKRALAEIADHQPVQRVILGMPLQLGDYDIQKQRFRLLYPVYGTGRNAPQPGGQPPLIGRGRGIGFSPYSGTKWTLNGGDSCTFSSQDYEPLAAPAYFEVAPMCTQDSVVDPPPHLPRVVNLVPRIFKLIPDQYPDWNYLQVDQDTASAFIDESRSRVIGISTRYVWAEMVLDIEGIETAPSSDLSLTEYARPGIDVVGAAFKIRPISMFVWAYGKNLRLIEEPNFMFAEGAVSIKGAPPKSVVTQAMITTPLTPEAAPTEAVKAAPGACPDALPPDAARDKCSEQATLVPAGMYVATDGRVRRLSDAGKVSGPESVAPAGPTINSPAVVNFGGNPPPPK